MKEHDTVSGNSYFVTCKAGCTITDASGELELTCEPGHQQFVNAPSDKLYTSEDAVVRKATFNYAPAALGLLGGGVSMIYIRLEYISTSGTQKITVPYNTTTQTGLWAKVRTNLDGDVANGIMMQAVNGTKFGLPRYDYKGISGNAHQRWMFQYHWLRYYGNRNNQPNDYDKPLICTVNWLNSKIAFADFGSFGTFNYQLDESEWYSGDGNGTAIALCMGCWDVYEIKISEGEEIKHSFVPVLDPDGVPCLYDTVSKQPFYNSGSGQFISGFTIAQARQLSKLPAGGGALTISLPSNYQEDAAVLAALATAEGKGWVLTVQTYEAEAGAASTFALRRIWVRKRAEQNGSYVAADGSRWQVEWCATMVGGDPQEHGYEPFRSVDAAVAYWELVPYVNPEDEFLTER